MHQLRAGRNRVGAVGGQASAAASPGDRPARGGPCGREEEPDLVDSQPALPPYRRVRPPAATVAAWIRRASARRAGRARGRLRYGSRPTTWTGITAATGGRGRLASAGLTASAQRPRGSTGLPGVSIRCQTTKPPETKRPRQGEVSIRNCGAHRFLRSGSDHPETPQTIGAEGGTRTHTLLRAADFESAASTDSATSAGWPRSVYKMWRFVQT